MKLARAVGLLPLFLMGVSLLFVLTRTEFHYDNWDYARNALTLWNLGPDPFGYAPWRPPLPTLVGAPLAGISWSVDGSLWFMRLFQCLPVLAAPLLLFIISSCLKSFGTDQQLRSWIVGIFGSTILVWASACDSIVDIPAGLFGAGAVAGWLRFRSNEPQLARLIAGTCWLLAAMTRQEYFVLGGIFIADDAARYLIEGRWKWHPWLGLAIPTVAFSMLSIPLAIFSGEMNPVVAFVNQLMANRETFAGLDRGFEYDKVALFAIPWSLLLISSYGLLLMFRRWRRDETARLVLLYTLVFLITHFVLIPQQYVRFLVPFLLPLAMGLAEALRGLKNSIQVPAGLMLLAMSLVGTVDLAGHFFQPEFRAGTQIKLAQKVAKGQQAWFYGKSFPNPIGQVAYGPGPEFSTYHFGANALRVVAGRRTKWVPYQKNGRLPVEVIADIQDGARMFFNPNAVMFYHSRGENAKPYQILQFSLQEQLPESQSFISWQIVRTESETFVRPLDSNFWTNVDTKRQTSNILGVIRQTRWLTVARIDQHEGSSSN